MVICYGKLFMGVTINKLKNTKKYKKEENKI